MIGRMELRLVAATLVSGMLLGRAEILIAKPACEELAGAVVFYDLLYGLGAGAILSGLYLAATDDGDDAGAKLAGGSLFGAVAGAGVGGLELGMRDCDGQKAAPASDEPKKATSHQDQDLRAKPLVVATPSQNGRSGWALGLTMALR